MNASKLARLIAQSLRRNWRNLGLSSVGIVVGIASLVLFTALGAGIKAFVLQDVFVVQRLEVVPSEVGVGAMGSLLGAEDSSGGLTDETVEKLRNLDGVRAAYPKMKLTFPSSVRGGQKLLGRNLVAELVADGIPPRLVDDSDVTDSLGFRDWGAPVECSGGEDCPAGHTCAPERGACRAKSCSKSGGSCADPAYCDRRANQCRLPIPVVASHRLLEIYNSNIHTLLGGASGGISNLPKLGEDDLVGFQFRATFGQSHLGKSAAADPLRRRLRLVGFTERAIRMGVTMPLGYVKRLNRRYRGDSWAGSYHSIVVEAASNDAVARVARQIRREFNHLTLSDRYERARRASMLVMIVTIVFNLISLIILAVAAVNIMHTFLMILLERRRELGLMRALGATRADIRAMVFGESSVVGLVAGTVGVAAGWGAMRLIDYLFATRVGAFPFKPDSLFRLEPWMVGVAIGSALLFCWLGALVPALRASDVDPAETLTGR